MSSRNYAPSKHKFCLDDCGANVEVYDTSKMPVRMVVLAPRGVLALSGLQGTMDEQCNVLKAFMEQHKAGICNLAKECLKEDRKGGCV